MKWETITSTWRQDAFDEAGRPASRGGSRRARRRRARGLRTRLLLPEQAEGDVGSLAVSIAMEIHGIAVRGPVSCAPPGRVNAFTTFAPAAHPATCSAAEAVCPSARPDRSGFEGFAASMTIFPLRLPAAEMASCVAG